MDDDRRNNELRDLRDIIMKHDVRVEHVEESQKAMRIDFHETIAELRQEIKGVVRILMKASGALMVIVPIFTVLIGLATKHYFGW